MRTYTCRIYQQTRRGEQEIVPPTVIESQRNTTVVATQLAQKHLAKDYKPPSAEDEAAVRKWQDELRTIIVELTDENHNVVRHAAHNLFSVPKKQGAW